MSSQIDWIRELNAIDVDTEKGLAKCQNNKEFYLKMFEIMLRNSYIDDLINAYESGDLQGTIDSALSIRGPMENLGVIKVYDSVQEIAFKLRTGGSLTDVKDAVSCAKREYEKVKAVFE